LGEGRIFDAPTGRNKDGNRQPARFYSKHWASIQE
jgi:hypothetical protein